METVAAQSRAQLLSSGKLRRTMMMMMTNIYRWEVFLKPSPWTSARPSSVYSKWGPCLPCVYPQWWVHPISIHLRACFSFFLSTALAGSSFKGPVPVFLPPALIQLKMNYPNFFKSWHVKNLFRYFFTHLLFFQFNVWKLCHESQSVERWRKKCHSTVCCLALLHCEQLKRQSAEFKLIGFCHSW